MIRRQRFGYASLHLITFSHSRLLVLILNCDDVNDVETTTMWTILAHAIITLESIGLCTVAAGAVAMQSTNPLPAVGKCGVGICSSVQCRQTSAHLECDVFTEAMKTMNRRLLSQTGTVGWV